MTRRLFPMLAIVLVTLAASPAPAAEAVAADAERPWFDTYSRFMFQVGRLIYGAGPSEDAVEEEEEATPPEPSPLLAGIGNMAANIVNEPMSLVTALVMRDPDAAAGAAGRFAINSTVGVLGFYDVATDLGLPPYHIDLGLALCANGVGEGPYIMTPFIGPRTARDLFTDVMVTNAVLYSMALPFLPTGASLESIVIIETVELIADVWATRQIDSRAKALSYDNYEHQRDLYLAQRRARCEELKTR